MPAFSYSQPNNEPPQPDYWEIYNAWQEHFTLFPDETQGEEAPIRSFNYWDIFWKSRVGNTESTGTFKEAENALLQLFDGETDICNNNVTMETAWEFVGPNESILNTTWPYLGRVECLYVDYINDPDLSILPDEIGNVTMYADEDPGLAGSQARALLNFAYGGQYHIDPSIEEGGGMSPLIAAPQPIPEEHTEDISLSVFPNPAKETVTFQVTMPLSGYTAIIEIYDIYGKEIKRYDNLSGNSKKVWALDDIIPGLYFWKFYVNNKLLESDKVIIIK